MAPTPPPTPGTEPTEAPQDGPPGPPADTEVLVVHSVPTGARVVITTRAPDEHLVARADVGVTPLETTIHFGAPEESHDVDVGAAFSVSRTPELAGSTIAVSAVLAPSADPETGPVTAQNEQGVVAAHRARMVACLGSDAPADAQVDLAFRVSADGRVQRVSARGLIPVAAADCIALEAARWRFPPHRAQFGYQELVRFGE